MNPFPERDLSKFGLLDGRGHRNKVCCKIFRKYKHFRASNVQQPRIQALQTSDDLTYYKSNRNLQR